ncbi:hypothetical protein IPJ63_04030 [Candidatus Nomurabacteria bacterium]|nr:MAG: hypothetical protein IPJ63_04030 [Candidatus Nomurabacteria bacterium]
MKTEKTRYRTISDGHVEFLQYYRTYKVFFGLIKLSAWTNVWYPYFDKLWGRTLDSSGYNGYACTYNTNLEKFKDDWPNIEDYFKWAEEQQKILEAEAKEYKEEIEKKKGEVKML